MPRTPDMRSSLVHRAKTRRLRAAPQNHITNDVVTVRGMVRRLDLILTGGPRRLTFQQPCLDVARDSLAAENVEDDGKEVKE